MASVVQIKSFISNDVNVISIEDRYFNVMRAIKIELKTCATADKDILLRLHSDLSDDKNNENTYSAVIQTLELNGYTDVLENAKTKQNIYLGGDVNNELFSKLIEKKIPELFKKTLLVRDDIFDAEFDEIDAQYSDYHVVSVFRDIHAIFNSTQISSSQKFSYVLGSFLSNYPTNTAHGLNYINKLTPTISLLLENIPIAPGNSANALFVTECTCLAFGFSIGQSLMTVLKHHANIKFLTSDDSESWVRELHSIDLDLLSKTEVNKLKSNVLIEDVIKNFIDLKKDDLLNLPQSFSIFHIVDFVIPSTQEVDLFPVKFKLLQKELVKEKHMDFTKLAIIHTLISLLQIQFPSPEDS
jgi:hypothetical protein